jgi:Dockerin type I domain
MFPGSRRSGLAACLLGMLISSSVLAAAQITIVNNDGQGEGFNDATAATPVGGNSGLTVGEQRLQVFRYAARIWSSALNSNVEIKVDSTFDPLTCTTSSAVLGSAGAVTLHRDFSGAPLSLTYYSAAQANALAGVDLASTSADISATFNGEIGKTGCLQGWVWYYGLDGNKPGNAIDLLTVVLHELGHGLGFQTFVNTSTGAKFNNRNDTFMLNLEDHSLGLKWSQMSSAQRVASAIDEPDLHWTGTRVNAAGAAYTGGINQGHFQMYGPNPLESGSSVAHFSKAVAPNELMEPVINPGVSDTSLTQALLADIGWSTPTTFTPVISTIPDLGSSANQPGSVNFAIDDHDSALSGLAVSVVSSNTALIDNSDFSVAGTGRLRALSFTPNSGATGVANITVTVSDGVNTAADTFVLTVTNTPPTVQINAPANNAKFMNTDTVVLNASASDPESGNLSTAIQWSSSLQGNLGSGAQVSRTLAVGVHVITASVTDGGGLTANTAITVTVYGDTDLDGMNDLWELNFFGNLNRNGSADLDGDSATDGAEFAAGTNPTDAAPVLTINAPVSGLSIASGTVSNLLATATDVEDGNLGAAVSWASSLQGALGNGSSLNVALLPGVHTITATVSDSAGATPLQLPSIQLSVIERSGDINGNGGLDVADLLLIQRHLSGQQSLDAGEMIRADVYPAAGTGDGNITVSDLLELQQALGN